MERVIEDLPKNELESQNISQDEDEPGVEQTIGITAKI